jgi:hypothetical protein
VQDVTALLQKQHKDEKRLLTELVTALRLLAQALATLGDSDALQGLLVWAKAQFSDYGTLTPVILVNY